VPLPLLLAVDLAATAAAAIMYGIIGGNGFVMPYSSTANITP
jgi:hypothetical protein